MNNLTLFVFLLVFGATRSGVDNKLKILDQCVKEGKYQKGLHIADQLLSASNKIDHYRVLQTKAQIFLYTENVQQFLNTAEKAYSLKKKLSPVFKAYYYAQKAYYYHFHILGDSAVKYADDALKLLHANWKDRGKIPYYQIYQIYGTTFLYRSTPEQFNLNGNTLFRIKLLQKFKLYSDSALKASEEWPCSPQEKAIIHRSLANRIMDIVGYKIRNSLGELENPEMQRFYADMAISEYRKGLKHLHLKEQFVRNSLNSLIALAYFSTAREKSANNILWPLIKKMNLNPVKYAGTNLKSNLYIIQYFTQYLLSKTDNDPRIYNLITIYKKLLPLWDACILDAQIGPKDTYGNSPYTMLSFLYGRLIKRNQSNQTFLKLAAGLSMENYRLYSISLRSNKKNFKSKRFRNFLIKLEEGISPRSNELHDLIPKKYLRINGLTTNIQNYLSPNEALLFQTEGMLARKAYFLITKTMIRFQWPQERDLGEVKNMQNKDFNSFKTWGIQYSQNLPFHKFICSGKIKKLYVASDLNYSFDLALSDTMGNDFSKLNYLKKKLNVIKVYNPIDFFSHYSDPMFERQVSPYFINETSRDRLPFSQNLILKLVQEKGSLKIFKTAFLNKKGILHLIGHGGIVTDPTDRWRASEQQKKELNLSLFHNEIHSDLIVLEICFGSLRRTTFLPDRDLQNNLISRGAKAVIASPYQTVDQSSAYIFEKFYTYLDQGITAEDALQKAKMDYLKTHKGSLAHPIYWSTYELTTNVKDLRIAPKTKPFPWEWIPMLSLILGVAGSVRWSLRKRGARAEQ